MPKTVIRETVEMTTRDRYSKVYCEVTLAVDGRELPNAAVLGGALEDAVKLIQERVTQSYQEVPARNEFEQPKSSPAAAVAATVAHTGMTDTSEPEPAPVTQLPQPKQVPFG